MDKSKLNPDLNLPHNSMLREALSVLKKYENGIKFLIDDSGSQFIVKPAGRKLEDRESTNIENAFLAIGNYTTGLMNAVLGDQSLDGTTVVIFPGTKDAPNLPAGHKTAESDMEEIAVFLANNGINFPGCAQFVIHKPK